MNDHLWTDQTQDLVADLLYHRDGDGHMDAIRILSALAEAGLLLPPGTETEIAWASHDGLLRWGVGPGGEVAARTEVSHGKGVLVSRREHAEPWRKAKS